jgi:HEPN domain-containing protein
MRDSRAEAKRWLRQAENDLAFGELALREGFFAQACFVAQQTAEKALKSIAYGRGERLVTTDRQPAAGLAVAPRVREASRRGQPSRPAYVATRYPNGLPGCPLGRSATPS